MKKIVFASLLLAAQLFAFERGSFGLNINDSDLEVEGRSSLANFVTNPIYRNFYIDANFINADDSLFGVGFYVENSPINYNNLLFDIGLRMIFSENEDDKFFAIPITAAAKARLYLGALPKSHLGVKLAFAPSPLTFQDADSYFEYRIEADMQIIQNVDVYVGYRHIDTDYDSHDYEFNDAVYAGFKFLF